MKKLIIFIPLFGLLVGCQPPLTREQRLTLYRTRCTEYGYQWGTPEFADCMMKQESRQEKISLEMRKAQALERRNWLAQEEIRVRERQLELENKKNKKH